MQCGLPRPSVIFRLLERSGHQVHSLLIMLLEDIPLLKLKTLFVYLLSSIVTQSCDSAKSIPPPTDRFSPC